MRIGIDIDGVLTNWEQFMLDYATKYCYENNLEIKLNPNEYDEIKVLNITTEQTEKFWNLYLGNYIKKTPIRVFAKDIIDKLKHEGNKIYIITTRDEYGLSKELYGKMEELTKQWLKDNEIEYDKIFFTKGSKMQTIIEQNIDIMIDDAPENIEELSSKILILCYNAQYNANIEGNNIIRVFSWYDIYEKIKRRQAK